MHTVDVKRCKCIFVFFMNYFLYLNYLIPLSNGNCYSTSHAGRVANRYRLFKQCGIFIYNLISHTLNGEYPHTSIFL